MNRNLELQKENQELKETINDLQKDYDALDFEQVELYAENAKLKQAIDIFERKYIGIYWLYTTNNAEEYNKMVDKFDENNMFDYLIEEDYELLKSVLGEKQDEK